MSSPDLSGLGQATLVEGVDLPDLMAGVGKSISEGCFFVWNDGILLFLIGFIDSEWNMEEKVSYGIDFTDTCEEFGARQRKRDKRV
ncbi:hypothetical protein TIFTF001_042721 [Ficus carica]|uniref:Uncharacterized protein n=1 Tax=Ficus carica TaxID=3494 RepID=A0AA88CZG6_FICCA|nr:hypothetical protein TIFTF001_042721 [Ficus carica]